MINIALRNHANQNIAPTNAAANIEQTELLADNLPPRKLPTYEESIAQERNQ